MDMANAPDRNWYAGPVAIALLMAGAGLFVAWLAMSEVSGHRVIGPPALAVLAVFPSFLGFVVGADWLLTSWPRRSDRAGPGQGRSFRLWLGLVLVPLVLSAPLVLLVGVDKMVTLPRAQRSWSQVEASLPEIESRRDADQLIERLGHRDPAVRAEAATVIAQLEYHRKRGAIPELATLLDDEDEVAIAAARALESIPGAPQSAIPELERMLLRGASETGTAEAGMDPVRRCAAEVLARKATPLGSQGLPVLLNALRHGDPDVRHAVAYGLGLIEKYPKNVSDARGPLNQALNDADVCVRAAAQASLDLLAGP